MGSEMCIRDSLFDGESHHFEKVCKDLRPIDRFTNSCETSLLTGHRDAVAHAIKKKLPVPSDVLDEYPALRRLQGANMAGDHRPLPEFGPEEDMVPFTELDDGGAIYSSLLDYEREIFHEDFWQQQDLYRQAKESLIKSHAEEFLKDTQELLKIAENEVWAKEVRSNEEREFRRYHRIADDAPIEDDDLAIELSDRTYDALIDRCKEEAEGDQDHPAWDWDKNYDNCLLDETFYELEYDHVSQEVASATEDMYVAIGTDPDEIVDYVILRRDDGNFVLFEDLSRYEAVDLGFYSDYADAVEAARKHARFGQISHEWPVNKSLSDDKWIRQDANSARQDFATPEGFRHSRKAGWARGSFAVIQPFSGRPGYQTFHLPTGMAVGRVWGSEGEAKRFADLLRPKQDWATVTNAQLDDVKDLVVLTEQDAAKDAVENRHVMRTHQRLQRQSAVPRKMTGFAGAVAFSANMLDVNPPRFDLDKHSAFKPRDEDRNWFVSRMRETAFETSIAEDFFDANIESYVPGRETMRQWATATHWKWHQMSEEEKSELLDYMANDEDVKAQLIFIDMADDFEDHIKHLVEEELKQYAEAVVLEDTSDQGYRVFFQPEHPDTMEVFAPGPISEETFLGYARGENAMETIADAEEIAGQFAFRGSRAIDADSLFKEMNTRGPDEWRPRTIILSRNTPCVSRLAHGFAKQSFGVVRTDWHLGDNQPGAAVIHLASGTPIKPFFRRDKDALAFADLIEKQADWHAIVSHEDFARESANLRAIARNTSDAIREVSRGELKRTPRKPAVTDNSFAGAVAFKVLPAEKHEREIFKLIDGADPSLRMSEKWQDFLTLASSAHRGAALPVNSDAWRENESRYLDVVDRYRRNNRLDDIRQNFPNALGHLTAACRQYEDDTLGRLHMQIAPNSALGQEFTPYSICKIMSSVTLENLERKQAEEINSGKGYLDVADPACGAGVMTIAFAENLLENGLDPTQHMRAYLTDVDSRACDMAYLNMALRDIPALVTHGNTLTQEIHSQSMTPAFVRARYEDIIKDRKAVNSRDIQESGLLDPKFSTGRDYRSLSESLVHLGAGPDLLDHTFVPSNDPAKGVPGEYARLQDVKELLWQANLVFDQAEKFGLSEPHPERSSMAPHKLYDSYHRELGARVGSFLENLDIAHPTTVRQAQPLLDEVAEHVKMFDAYVDAYGAPGTNYEALTTPRWKVADQMPVFGDLDELRVSEADIPDDDAIYSKLEELYPFYERQVKAEYLSRFGKDFIIDDVYLSLIHI